MAVLKDHYYRLASELPEEQIKAATSLVTELQEEKSDEEWDYALKRLIKGLTSTKQSARIGFSMALVEVVLLLIQDPENELTVSGYLDLLLELTDVKSNMKGKEERAVLFGRLFGLQSLLNSGLLYNEKYGQTRQLTQFCSCLINLALAKPWIRESSFFTLSSFLIQFQASGRIDGELFLNVFQQINDAGLNLTTEGIAIYLSIPAELRPKYASAIDAKGKSNWKNGDPFSKGNIQLLSKVLKEVDTNVDEENKPKQKGHWSPRVHFVWDLTIKDLTQGIQDDTKDIEDVDTEEKENLKRSKYSSKSSKKQKKVDSLSPQKLSIREFWKVVIDESFFADKSSHERKYWGFEVFIKFIKSVSNAEDLESLFTPNLMRCLINQSSASGRMLHNISVQVLKAIIEVATSNATKAVTILDCLLSSNKGGNWNFDLITKLKSVDEIISGSTGAMDSIRTLLISKIQDAAEENVKELSTESEVDEEPAAKFAHDNVQKWALDKLLLLIRSNKVLLAEGNRNWLKDILKYLIKLSYFQTPGISANTRNTAQARLNSILSDVIALKTDEGEPWLLFCVNYFNKQEESGKTELVTPLANELLSTKQEIFDVLEEIKQKKKKADKKSKKHKETSSNIRKEELYCFQLLFSMVLIQLYSADEEAISVLEELQLCYKNTFLERDDEIDTSQILTEIILSFIAKKSALLKKLSIIIWENILCVKGDDDELKLNSESLQLLFDVLIAKENKEGLQAVFEGQGEYEEEKEGEDGDEGDGEEDDNDDEDSDDESDEESSSSDSDDENETSIMDIDKQTSFKLAEALGIPTESSGEVKFDDLSSEDDDAESDSMDDEQMMQIDGQLSRIFKERRDILSAVPSGNKRKAEVEEAKEQMIFFKYRILDLLESFNKIQPNSIFNLDMIKPVIILIGLTLDKNLGTKAHKLLKTRLSKTRIIPSEIKETESVKSQLMDSLKWLHEQSKKNTNNAHNLACSQASIVISKNLLFLDELSIDSVIDIYSDSLKNWAKNSKSKVQAMMFFDFINWINSTRQKN